jgi:hypothetical protein
VTVTPLDRASPEPLVFTDPESGISLVQSDGRLRVVAPGQDAGSVPPLVFPAGGMSTPGSFSSGLVAPDGVHLVSTWSGDYSEWLAVDDRIDVLRSIPRVGSGQVIGAFLASSVPEVEPGVTPPSMFERSGSTVEAAPTTTAASGGGEAVATTAAPVVTTGVAASGDDDGRAWWPWVGVGVLAMVGVAAGVVLPRRR